MCVCESVYVGEVWKHGFVMAQTGHFDILVVRVHVLKRVLSLCPLGLVS